MITELELLRRAMPTSLGPSSEVAARSRADLMRRAAPPRWSRRRIVPLTVPALAAVAGAVVLALSLTGRGGETAWAAGLVRVAEAAPRLLVGQPGWHVTRADEFRIDLGEMTFSDGGRELELRWEPASDASRLVGDRAASADLSTTAEVAGVPARLFRYEGGGNDFTAIFTRGGYALEARGSAPSVDAFRALLASLHEVDVDTWLAAMPASVVKPSSRAGVVRQMLADIPLPAGFDAGALERGTAVRDRYQLGAQVAGAVACAWIERWVEARRSGDTSVVRRAVAAMATSRDWAVLHEMDAEGAYPEVLWEYAGAIAADAPVSGGKPLSVAQSYRDALGCDG